VITLTERAFADRVAWNAHLNRLGISALRVNPDPALIATEGAPWGSHPDRQDFCPSHRDGPFTIQVGSKRMTARGPPTAIRFLYRPKSR
jgi:hypothetical protein